MIQRILIFFYAVLLIACSRHEPQRETDHYRRIQTQIDRKEYDQAEGQLQKILAQNPENQRARVILASMYVHKAGITLQDYFELEKLSRLNENPSENLVDLKLFEKMEIPSSTDFGQVLAFLKRVNSVSARIHEISLKFEKIPLVDEQGAQNLSMALMELEKIENPTRASLLYRGVVKLYYFKFLWKSGFFLEFGEQKFCSQKVIELADRLGGLEDFVVKMVRDISAGFPKSQGSFLKQVGQFDHDFKKAKAWLKFQKDSQKTIKEISEKYAKAQQIEGFKCDF